MLTVNFDILKIKNSGLLLDAGCGSGRHSIEALNRGATVVSIDLDMESLRKTRFTLGELKKYNPDKKKCSFFVHSADAMNLPFDDATFDSIICSEVMEHVSDDLKACKELSRVLKQYGRIAITVPTFFSEMIYDVLTHEYFSTPGGHIRKYLPKKLVEIMNSSGLEIYSIDFKHSFHTIWWAIRSVVGLHLDKHPLTKSYHKFLHFCLMSKFMRKAENFFDNFFPKSIIIYAWKK